MLNAVVAGEISAPPKELVNFNNSFFNNMQEHSYIVNWVCASKIRLLLFNNIIIIRYKISYIGLWIKM